jgi:predicted SnoaL-like aldol condensation-catalyzing enzyme
MTNVAVLLAAAVSLATTPRVAIEHLFAAFNRHDVEALQKFYAPDAKLTSSDFCNPRTGVDVTRTYGSMFKAFPDIRDEVISIVIDGDRAAVRFTSSSDAPEHKFRFELMTYFRFSDGLIVEDDTIFDTQGRPCES